MKLHLPLTLGGLVMSLVTTTATMASQAANRPEITLSADGAAPSSLTFDGKKISFAGKGGFLIYDAVAKQRLDIPTGKLSTSQGKTSYEATGDGLALRAAFETHGGYVLVKAEVENLRGGDRGLIIDYRLPRMGSGAYFSNGLEQREAMKGKEVEGNAFPVAAMCTTTDGVAMAIPPSDPRDFGMVGDENGFSLRFYLGVSPKPQRFPNKASFSFIIYGAEAGWGFRSALDRYYAFFPEFYTPKLKKEGLFMFQLADRIPPNVDQYGFDMVEMQFPEAVIKKAVARDQKNGVTTFPYTIVGQREIKFLPTLPKNYEDAMGVYQRWTLADHAGHELTKENVTNQGDIHVKEEIDSSACQFADGSYAMVLRETKWGAKSVTFKTNPNPDLFSDQQRPSVGSYQLALDDKWISEYPEFGGIFVDSLGANWPSVLNYREDHFKYARYPLTIDGQGRVALQNTTSHYEFVETLRNKLRKSGRLVMGNGVYVYKSRAASLTKKVEEQKYDNIANEFVKGGGPSEHYRGSTMLGRFFLSALLDAATSEFGSKATVQQCQDNRVLLGRKTYAFINYAWTDQPKVEEFINKTLSYGIFASTTTNYATDEEYEENPKGYLRDKTLIDWYFPLMQKLVGAKWQPVRYATVEGKEITGERFGSGDTVYFTLYNDSDSKQAGTMTIDLKSCGFTEGNVAFTEIARGTALPNTAGGKISLQLEPKRTYIIQMTKSGAAGKTRRVE